MQQNPPVGPLCAGEWGDRPVGGLRNLQSSKLTMNMKMNIKSNLRSNIKIKKPRQLQLFKRDLKSFGGSLLLGKRKGRRPFSSKDSLHLVLRSSWAQGENSFLRKHNKSAIERLISRTAANYQIKVYQRAIVGNHLHLVIRAKQRKQYHIFIRVLSSQIASHVMRQQSFRVFMRSLKLATKPAPSGVRRRGDPPRSSPHTVLQEPQGKEQQFWQMRPFSRVLNWGRDFKMACAYVTQNTLEAPGFLPFSRRKGGGEQKGSSEKQSSRNRLHPFQGASPPKR